MYCSRLNIYFFLMQPLFLQRCLSYKRQAKYKRRIQMAISLSWNQNEGVQSHCLFPLYILLARLVSGSGIMEHAAVYRFSRACLLTSFTGVEGSSQAQGNFVLPEMNMLALEAKTGSLAVLLVSFAGVQSSQCGFNLTNSPLENIGGHCLLGKIPLLSLYTLWERSPNMKLGQRVELTSSVDMHSCFLKLSCLAEDKHISIQIPSNSAAMDISKQVQITISAEKAGAKENSPYLSYTSIDISSSSMSHIMRLRVGNVVFNYRYYNNKLQKTEVTEDFCCPFCLVKCASFKGLRYHLPSSHDLFHFEFWVTEEYQAVNVLVKTDNCRSEMLADCLDPKHQTFSFCSKRLRLQRLRNVAQNPKYVDSLVFKSNSHAGGSDLVDRSNEFVVLQYNLIPIMNVVNQYLDKDFDPLASYNLQKPENYPLNDLILVLLLKTSVEKKIPISRTLLHKRQFFHSHRTQPMTIEQIMSERDSEDEVDDDVADVEDRRLLDDFVDVAKDEKQMMHMWNSFVRKHRVLADWHIPWACEAFSRLHGHDLVQAPAVIW
ncbi:polycomb group protein EMBRYONIC FLOWER 2-like isoform X3 [Tripterygium wilfordii]|uniref:Polycomb group protein EMBRYONIC FLOWER 2-like isoform X3 n=1 Tax=Tripterygium wilfordii TaxID=458696 RepID=A0A7J7CAA0_TRIWF|nr:polycomb group protein EMBRYONIC FLOWER 2-like isoform X3 [Tripterygium wilfordii]